MERALSDDERGLERLLLGLRTALAVASAARRLGGDDRQLGADVDGVALLHEDLGHVAGRRRGDLGVDLVGGDLEEGLVLLDLVAHLLEPLGDGALGDGLPELGHGDVGHQPLTLLPLQRKRGAFRLASPAG